MPRDIEEAWSPEYDSTWEEEEEDKEAAREQKTNQQLSASERHHSRKWFKRAALDLQNYRHGYRDNTSSNSYLGETSNSQLNLEFYQKKRRFEPEGVFIDVLLEDWKDNYTVLERNHYYIQWLFPLREHGMNSYAKPLTLTEIQIMKKDKDIKDKFIAAYKLMLGFYGIKLQSDKTGEVALADNWIDRFKNLNNRSHNNLRITRILKCLGELGYEHFQAPLVRFFLEQTLCHSQLQNVKRSVLDYFMFTVKNKGERRKLVRFAWENYKPQEKFIWGPADKLRQFKLVEEQKVTESEITENLDEQEDNRKPKNNDLVKCEMDGKTLNFCKSLRDSNCTTAQRHKLEKHGKKEEIAMNERIGEQTSKKASSNTKQSAQDVEGNPNTEKIIDCDHVYVMGENKAVGKDPNEETTITNQEKTSLEVKGTKRKLSISGSNTPLAIDEGNQVSRVEDKVKKLKLGEKSSTDTDYYNGVDNTKEDIPGDTVDNPSSPSKQCNLQQHSEDCNTKE